MGRFGVARATANFPRGGEVPVSRDPRAFDRPGQFLVDRGSNDHLVFGYGPHFCLGAHLARVQLRAMSGELLRRTTWLEAAGEPTLLRSSFQRGVKALPLRWT